MIAGPVDASAIGNILVQLIGHKEIRDIAQGRELVRNSFHFVQYDPVDKTRWREAYQEFLDSFHLAPQLKRWAMRKLPGYTMR